jgi:CheY-like chemotaxis protein
MPSPRVLVVEDEAAVREVWADALEYAGYEVLGAASGAEALAALDRTQPDVILLDMLMPDMDGFELLMRLRVNPAWAAIPVLVVSALGTALDAALDPAALETLRVAAILTKPVALATLLEHVQRALAGRPRPATLPDRTPAARRAP